MTREVCPTCGAERAPDVAACVSLRGWVCYQAPWGRNVCSVEQWVRYPAGRCEETR